MVFLLWFLFSFFSGFFLLRPKTVKKVKFFFSCIIHSIIFSQFLVFFMIVVDDDRSRQVRREGNSIEWVLSLWAFRCSYSFWVGVEYLIHFLATDLDHYWGGRNAFAKHLNLFGRMQFMIFTCNKKCLILPKVSKWIWRYVKLRKLGNKHSSLRSQCCKNETFQEIFKDCAYLEDKSPAAKN